MGFRRHKATKKGQTKQTAQSGSGRLRHGAFSVGQKYSSAGCSPAEPVSAYPDKLKIIPTFDFHKEGYPAGLGFR